MRCAVFTVLVLLAVSPAARGQALKTPQQPDHSLNQAGPACIGTFFNITQRFYGQDKDCALLIQQAFAAVSKDACPKDGTGAGSPVQRCLGLSSDTTDAWTDFVRACPVLNVKKRQQEQSKESTRYFSCFGDFPTPEDFHVYASVATPPPAAAGSGKGSSASMPSGAAAALVVTVAAAAAAAGVLL